MTLSTLILLGIAAGEVATIVMVNKQAGRVEKLEREVAEQKKKKS